MKNLILWVASMVIFTVDLCRAQLPVSTQPQNKKVLIEHFYGYKCFWSPHGDSIAEAVKLSHAPGEVSIINIHNYFGYSAPSQGWPDYRTNDGALILNMPGMYCPGIPAGPVNRHRWSGFQGMAMDRSHWKKYSDSVVAQPSYVNVALQGTLDVISRLLTVQAEVYYTGTCPVSTNSLHIMLLEDNVVGPQVKPVQYVTNWNSDGTYNHQNMLRNCVTPTFGAHIPGTSVGFFKSYTFYYTVPAAYGTGTNATVPYLGNLRLVGFVTESDREVQNVASGPISLQNFAYVTDASISSIQSPSLICSSLADVTFSMANTGSTAIVSAVLSCALNNTVSIQYTWNGLIKPLTRMQTIHLPALNYASVSPVNSFEVVVASVNYAADQNASNNDLTATVLQSPYKTNDLNLKMEFIQDQFGEESRWEIIDESTNTVIDADGPWTRLSGPGTQLHLKFVTLPSYGCYRLVVTDSKGDGISNSSGAGSYSLSSSSKVIFGSKGKFGFREVAPFEAYNITGISTASSQEVAVYPNPTTGAANLVLYLPHDETVDVFMWNSIGAEVTRIEKTFLNAGSQTIPVGAADLENGIYFIRISTSAGTLTKTLLVEK